jgi:hypothetical protein
MTSTQLPIHWPTPEQHLMAAVLEDAIATLRRPPGGPRRRARLQDEVLAWLGSPDRTWPFAFRSICDALGLDPGAVLATLGAPRGTHGIAA